MQSDGRHPSRRLHTNPSVCLCSRLRGDSVLAMYDSIRDRLCLFRSLNTPTDSEHERSIQGLVRYNNCMFVAYFVARIPLVDLESLPPPVNHIGTLTDMVPSLRKQATRALRSWMVRMIRAGL